MRRKYAEEEVERLYEEIQQGLSLEEISKNHHRYCYGIWLKIYKLRRENPERINLDIVRDYHRQAQNLEPERFKGYSDKGKEKKREWHKKRKSYPPFLAFSSFLNEALMNQNFNQNQFSRLLGISRQAVFYYTHGISLPSREKFPKIAEILKIDESELERIIQQEFPQFS